MDTLLEQATPRRTAGGYEIIHSFGEINWDGAENETRIAVLQEMVAVLLNRLDAYEPLVKALREIAAPGCESWHYYAAIACEQNHPINEPAAIAGWDYCLDPNNREDAPIGDLSKDRCFPCLARAALVTVESSPEREGGE